MSKLQLGPSLATTVNDLNSKLTDSFAEGVENPGLNPAVDPIVLPMDGYLGPVLQSAERQLINGSYMGSHAALLKALYGTDWTPVTYETGWGDWADPNYLDLQYRKDGLGKVHVRGLARKLASVIAAPSTIAILPVSCWPINGLVFDCRNNGFSGEVRILSNGVLRAEVGDFSASAGWWSINISFEVP